MPPRSIEQQLAELTGSLRREYAAHGVPTDEVDAAIAAVRTRFAGATVLTYVPILVERGVRDRLRRPATPPVRECPSRAVPEAPLRRRERDLAGVLRSLRLRTALRGRGDDAGARRRGRPHGDRSARRPADRALRAHSSVPVIIVSARDSELDKVVAFELGADDDVCRPYSSRELVARIRAVLRRRAPGDARADTDLLRAGPVVMDVRRHRVTMAGTQVTLRLREFELLQYLLHNVRRVFSRRQILDRVWGGTPTCGKTIDVHVSRLRARIEPDPATPRYVTTVRYRLAS